MKTILAFSLAIVSLATAFAKQRPNILWLSAEDINDHWGCYGDPHAITPNIDQMAKEGVRYTNVFTAAGVCAPCRSTIITGMYQTTIGTMHMRSKATMPPEIKPFPTYLREANYYCTNNSKQDYQFTTPKDAWDVSSGKAHWKNRPTSDDPFFAVFNFGGCHESGIANPDKYRSVSKVLTPEQRQDPAKLTTLPPYYPDTPVVREDWKRNYELITALDHWVGEHIAALKKAGLYEDTIIMIWSDHGVGLPRAKRWLYDSGTRIPLVVRIPDKFRVNGQGLPGTTNDQLISSLDLGITALNLAGLPAPSLTQGRAFLGENLSPPRDYIYGARDRMDERYDIIRSVRSKRYRYIRNYEPLKPYFQYMNTPEKGATMKEIRRISQAGKAPAPLAQFMEKGKPVEEFYDLKNDPHEIKNLIADPSLKPVIEKLRNAHNTWSSETRDLGLIPEPEMVVREKAAGSRYAILAESSDKTLSTRLGEIARLASDGEKALPKLLAGLADKDAAVRYWAATGIGNISPKDKSYLTAVVKTMKEDSSEVVRVAAARAVLRIGTEDELALAELTKALANYGEWCRLHAAIVLDEADEKARPTISALKDARENAPNKYIVRVVNKALNDLLGTNKQVP